MIFYIFIAILIIIDQISKQMIHSNFELGQTLPIINDFFHLTYVQNRGVAFGILQNKAIFINFISIGAVLSMIWYLHLNYKKISKLEVITWTLIIAGALGNILDRIFRGYVVDMIDFRGIWQYVFNLADAYINIGIFLMIISSILDTLAKKRGGNTK
ncbi:MAG: signal peptidase II [Fusobacteriaceae bacterium]|nr:signal peptidase II [Fusobacteriaceae bacterium]MBN2837678.1 signal peptidase II [Fusobacteriaceae bacterium]